MYSEALTFDDLLLVPRASNVLPSQALLKTSLTKTISLNIPLISSPMDTVTESKLAISIAQQGGIGIIHKNLSIEDQAKEVRIVKRAANGVIYSPATLDKNVSIREAKEIMISQNVSSFPITNKGDLVGIVTNRDLKSTIDEDDTLDSIMTPKKNLIMANEKTSLNEAKKIMRTKKIEKLPLINRKGELKGLICIKDIYDNVNYPMAAKDKDGRLRVGAAINTSSEDIKRAEALVREDVDVLVIDTAHGHHQSVIQILRTIKKKFKKIPVIAGNIATAEAARALIQAGADAIKVGIGPGSICTTRIVAGVGVPQATAISNVVKETIKTDTPVIADGGIKFSGDIAKALALGASTVMIGSLFAAVDEAPSETIFSNGRSFKVYRGMGSIAAMKKGSKNRYNQKDIKSNKLVPEGIEGAVPVRGPLVNTINQLIGGLRATMGYIGAKDIKTLVKKAKFVKISAAGLKESHVHNVMIMKEAPNYQINQKNGR